MGIHGDKSQQERDWVLNGKHESPVNLQYWLIKAVQEMTMSEISFSEPEFKYGKAPILIATDVASRGLGQYPICAGFLP